MAATIHAPWRTTSTGFQVKVTVDVTADDDGCPLQVDVWLAHLPCDQDQNGSVGLSDAGQFGRQWREAVQEPLMLDHNGGGITIGDPGWRSTAYDFFLPLR